MITPSQDWYNENVPYCAALMSLVKMGTVINEIPFCTKLQTVNQNDALIGLLRLSYLVFSFAKAVGILIMSTPSPSY